MAVPSSGQITLVGIFSEKNEDDYTITISDNNTTENERLRINSSGIQEAVFIS